MHARPTKPMPTTTIMWIGCATSWAMRGRVMVEHRPGQSRSLRDCTTSRAAHEGRTTPHPHKSPHKYAHALRAAIAMPPRTHIDPRTVEHLALTPPRARCATRVPTRPVARRKVKSFNSLGCFFLACSVHVSFACLQEGHSSVMSPTHMPTSPPSLQMSKKMERCVLGRLCAPHTARSKMERGVAVAIVVHGRFQPRHDAIQQ